MSYEISILLNYFVVLIEAVAFIVFSSTFFQHKINMCKLILSTVALTSLSIICLTISESNVVFKLALLTCINSLYLVVIYRASLIKCIGISLLFVSFINVADNFFFVVITTMIHIEIQELYQDPYGYYLVCYIAKICEVMIFTLIGSIIKQKLYFTHATWQHWAKIFILPASSLAIAVFLWPLYWVIPAAGEKILLCTMVLFVINIFDVVMLNYLDREQQLIQDNLVLRQNIKYQNDTVKAWANAYKDQRKLTHDFQNQLSVICGMAEREAPDSELLAFVHTVLKNSTSQSLVVKTGRLAADVLLSQKYHLARSKGISFSLQLDDLTHFGLKDEHLVVVLANLIDNAIEACEKIDNGKSKKMMLVMKVEEESSFLYIENTTAFPVKILDNQVVLPAKQSAEHGYGLKNATAILNSYKAVFAIVYKEEQGLFCFSAQVPEIL
mgnify:FL=1